MRQLAERADVSVEAVRRMIFGLAAPEPLTVNRVAGALQRDVREVAAWVGQVRTERQSWTPPAEADLLNDRQRKALDNLIRSMVEPPAVDFVWSDPEGGTVVVEMKQHGGDRATKAPLRRVARRNRATGESSSPPDADG